MIILACHYQQVVFRECVLLVYDISFGHTGTGSGPLEAGSVAAPQVGTTRLTYS